MSRVGFWDLFELNPDGTFRPLRKLKIAGVTLTPDTSYPKNVRFSGYDFFQHEGRYLEIQDAQGDNPAVITGVYNAT